MILAATIRPAIIGLGGLTTAPIAAIPVAAISVVTTIGSVLRLRLRLRRGRGCEAFGVLPVVAASQRIMVVPASPVMAAILSEGRRGDHGQGQTQGHGRGGALVKKVFHTLLIVSPGRFASVAIVAGPARRHQLWGDESIVLLSL
jgi:hypothetical protein